MTCTTTEEVSYVVGDTLPELVCTYNDEDGNPVDITGYSFELHIDFTVPVSVAGSIVDAPAGVFKFSYGPGDISEVGKFNTEIAIIDALSKRITYQFVKFDVRNKIL